MLLCSNVVLDKSCFPSVFRILILLILVVTLRIWLLRPKLSQFKSQILEERQSVGRFMQHTTVLVRGVGSQFTFGFI